MRIAYVCADPGVPVFGQKGCSVHVQEILGAFLRQGIQIELFATRLGGLPPHALKEVPVHPLPPVVKGPQAFRERAALENNRDLRERLEREGPFDMVYERYSIWSFSAMEYAKQTSVPGLLEVNAPLIDEQERYRGLVDRAAAEQVAQRVLCAATTLLPVSQEVATYLLNHYPVNRDRVFVTSNGVTPNRFLTPRLVRRSDSSKPFVVGFIGSLKPWHGVDSLIEAFATLYRQEPDSCLRIVGDGPERESLMAGLTADHPELQNAVHFTGAVSPSVIPDLLNTMDVTVAPYPARTDFYFSPLKVYEYMAAGLPVVASAIGELTRLIKDDYNGLLVPPGDCVALATALAQLRSDPVRCTRLGQAARQTVLRGHTWDNVVNRILRTVGIDPRCEQVLERETVQ